MNEYKGYLITTNPSFPTLVRVSVAGRGGKIPKVLDGNFTSHSVVKSLIDAYQRTRKVGDVDDKTNPTQ